MIRDPSDGTVRGHHHKPLETQGIAGKSDDLITGLPEAPAKSDELIRLEKSREWLKSYSGFSPSTQ